MGTTTKWGRAKLNSSTIGQTVTMRQQPAPKMYHEYRLQISPAANTVSKSHQPAVQNTGFRVGRNHPSQNTGRGSSRNTGRGSSRPAKEKKEQFAAGERKSCSSQPEKEKGKRRRNAQKVGGRMFAKGSTPATDFGEDDDCGLLPVERN
ncbi:hypothetical protein Adt_38512 [Abeliophyllum distichum]|uniref:Uncharacterized protein n=1 Tax=Abeliophyllum distichum TaxID=126358 RepID=A0ABD1Q2G3_9LAMI